MQVLRPAVAGWPVAKGGSQQLTAATVSYLESLGGKVITGFNVETLSQLPAGKIILFDVTPRQLLKIAGSAMPETFRRSLGKFRYGMAAYKIDWALREPVPWRAEECRQAGTLHLGATLDEICASEQRAWNGQPPERPLFCLRSQVCLIPHEPPPGSIRRGDIAMCHSDTWET